MSNKRPGMQQLVDRLLDGSEQRLSAAELDAVLAWLSGSDRHDGDALAGILGHALDHPRRRIAIYDQLDIQLFESDRLDLTGAHLAAGLDDELRRARYRRLMKAYHPDSYPDHADWLTPRSQAVHQSYARFRKGQPPEGGSAAEPKDIVTKRPRQQYWSGARRSARLTPGLGPGPLSRLRTWLLGIENLQQRILIGLVIICLVPVLSAYLAYKPYRAIQSPDSVVQAPAAVEEEETDQALAREPDDDPGDAAPVVSDETAELSVSMPEAVAPILPSWERPRADEVEREREPVAPEWQQTAAEKKIAAAPKPAPEASLLELAAWAETLSDTVRETLNRASSSLAAAAEYTSAPAEPAPAESRQRPEQSAERELASRNDRSARNTLDRAQQAPNSNNTDNAGDIGGDIGGAIASTSSARQPEEAAKEAPARESRPEPETAAERPRRASAQTSVAAVEPAPAPSVTEPKEVVVVREEASESVLPAAQLDAPDERTRRHIEELLAGYRTSFENGWLEDFLDHFTPEPRENKHSGRRWFRSNYGWLFNNSERRRLELDITDITRTDRHWTAVAQFDLQVDYGDRPNVRSSRQVRYRIETNEHDQLRIAAIEY